MYTSNIKLFRSLPSAYICFSLLVFFALYVGGLGLAGVELTFFIAAGMVLWFGFMAPTMLVAHQCSESNLLFYFPLCPHLPPVNRLRVGKKLGGGNAAGTTELAKGIFCTIQRHAQQ